nr:phospholipase-like protein [Tanacetum cinerariifolium]
MLRLANDRVAWNKYPWGSYVWPTLYSQLRNANAKCWTPLYVAQPTNEDVKTYSIFGYTWAFKTWIMESFRVTAIRYFDCYNRYPRVAAWSKKKRRFLGYMVIPFLQENMPAARLTPGDNKARSDWWISSKAYFDVFIGQVERSATQYWQPDISSQPGSYYSFGQVTSHMGRPNLQTTIETHHDVDGIFDQTWILESFRITTIRYFDCYNRYPRVAAWSKKKRRFLGYMVIPFLQENMPDARLTPEDNGLDRTGGFLPVRQENKEPINVDQHYGLSDFSQLQSMQEDRVLQLAMMILAHEFNDASTAKDELGKACEKCRDIPLEQRDSIEIF